LWQQLPQDEGDSPGQREEHEAKTQSGFHWSDLTQPQRDGKDYENGQKNLQAIRRQPLPTDPLPGGGAAQLLRLMTS
jgi:hypothetical protein